MFRALLLLLCCSIFISANARFFPGEGDVVNYRLVGFTVPKDSKAEKYLFEVAEYSTDDNGNIVTGTFTKQLSDSNRTIIMMPHFDKGYTWRVSYLNKRGKTNSSTPYYHFRTGNYPTLDSGKYRLLVVDTARHHDDYFVIVDFVSVIYDMKGNPVWYLPDIKLVANKNEQMRDLKPTKTQSFTATGNFGAFEIDYNGKLLWKAPDDGKVSGDTSEHYHHEFTKLNNGNYMVASLAHTWLKVPDNIEIPAAQLTTDMIKKREDGKYYKKITVDNIIEYNNKKEVVWFWKSTDHFTVDDFFRDNVKGPNMDMHLNAFYFDEKKKAIYMSFRNTNEVVKIEYPSGKILNRYGKIWLNDTTLSSERLFYGQHCVRQAKDGRIYLFNNNADKRLLTHDSIRKKIISKVSVFEELETKTGLKKIWEYDCNMDTFALTYAGAGGGVEMLDDNCYFVNMGSASRVFIVNPKKEIIWNAVPQYGDSGMWYPLGQYRASIISRKDLEKFIFREINSQ